MEIPAGALATLASAPPSSATSGTAPVANQEAADFEAAQKAFIDDARREYAWTGDDDDVDLPPTGDLDAQPEVRSSEREAPQASPSEAAKPATPPSSAPQAPSEDPAVARGLDRLVARETEIALREAKVAEFERQRTAHEAEMRTLRDQTAALDRLRGGDPGEALRALGYDPDHAVNLMIAAKLGDKAPPELRRALEQHQANARVAKLEQELANRDRAQQESAFRESIAAGVRTHTASISETSPLAGLRAADAARLERELVEVVHNDARDRLARGEDPRAPLITPEEAVRRLEARYAWTRPAPAALPVPAVTPPPAGALPAAGTQTPSTQASPGANTQRTPRAPRPLKPWQPQGQRELEEAGIRAAMAEYRRGDAR